MGHLAHTSSGSVAGVVGEDCVRWLGIPFAEPPVGPLRWRAPQPVKPWDGVLTADQERPIAVQRLSAEDQALGRTTDEDCLYLDVCAPSGAPPAGGWPVLLSIHGGGNAQGSKNDLDGAPFARAGIVVVSANYRLGAFGFLNLSASQGPEEADAGVAGFLDQIAALAWTKVNVPAFGGDPGRITVYGESAGAKAVCNLMGTPAARLMRRAIINSGAGASVAASAATAPLADAVLSALGARDGDQARRASAAEVLDAQTTIVTGTRQTWVWRPTLHPQILPRQPLAAIADGSAAGVDLLVGANTAEGGLFALVEGVPECAEPARAVLTDALGPQGRDELLAAYARRGIVGDDALIEAMGDERYATPTRQVADAQSRHSSVYRYLLGVGAPGAPKEFDGVHACDLPMVWHAGDDPSVGTPARRAVALGIHEAWASFIRSGVPSSAHLPTWPRYDESERETMILDDEPRVVADPLRDERLIWGDAAWEYGTWWTP